MLRPFPGCRSRREPVLRQRAPGLLGITIAERAGERGRVQVENHAEEGNRPIRAVVNARGTESDPITR